MTATATTTTKKNAFRIDGSPLLPQLSAAAGADKYRHGKLAFDYLGNVAARPAQEIRDTLDLMNLASLNSRDLGNETDAALAFATAAVLDVRRKGGRMTSTELIETAMERLDEELAAGW
jgi:hypothetical protein